MLHCGLVTIETLTLTERVNIIVDLSVAPTNPAAEGKIQPNERAVGVIAAAVQ